MSQFKKGVVLSYANLLITNIGGLLVTPFVVKSLGNSEYGLYSLMGSTIAYLSLLNFGVNNSIVRYISKYLAEKEDADNRIAHFLGNVSRIYMVIISLIYLVGIVLYFNLDWIFNKGLSPAELERAKVMYLLLLVNVSITVPGGAFQSIATAYQLFAFPRLVTLIRYIVRIAMIIVILNFGSKGIGLIVLDTLLNLGVIIATSWYVKKKINVPYSLSFWDKNLVKEIFSYSFFVFLYGFVHFFQWTGGQVLLGITTNTVEVGVFAIGIMLAGYYNAYAGVINSMLMPRAAHLIQRNPSGLELTQEIARFVRISGIPMYLVFTAFIVFGQHFIRLWLNASYSYAYDYAILMMGAMTIVILQVFPNSILESMRKNRFRSLLSLFSILIALAVGYFLSMHYRGYGVIIPIAISLLVGGLIMNWYFKKIFDFQILYFYKSVLLKQVIAYTPLVIGFLYVNQWIDYDWIKLIVTMASYVVLYGLLTYFVVMNAQEKQNVINGFAKLKSKFIK